MWSVWLVDIRLRKAAATEPSARRFFQICQVGVAGGGGGVVALAVRVSAVKSKDDCVAMTAWYYWWPLFQYRKSPIFRGDSAIFLHFQSKIQDNSRQFKTIQDNSRHFLSHLVDECVLVECDELLDVCIQNINLNAKLIILNT